jgi:1-phosphofructokinase
VLAPTPAVTVTVEGGDEQGDEIHFHGGGQGVWVARMATTLGAEAILCAAVAGEAGKVLEALLADGGVDLRAVRAHGRSAAYVHDRRGGQRQPIASTSGARLWRHEADDLFVIMLSAGLEAGVAALTGPQPPDAVSPEFYERMAHDLRANEVMVLADLTGPALAGALAGGVDLLKVSHVEMQGAGMLDSGSAEPGDLIAAAEKLRGRGAQAVLISRAEQPAVALIGDRALEFAGPKFEPTDHTGAGDSMFAAVGVGLASGAGLIESVRLGVAAGALNVTRRGLGSGHRREIEHLKRRVAVRELSAAP